MYTALWIMLECGRLMAWALVITFMRRQDVHTDTSVMTTFAELYTSTSYMAWHTDNLSLGVKVELKAGVVQLFRCPSITCSFSQNMRMWVKLCLFIRCERVPFSFKRKISSWFEAANDGKDGKFIHHQLSFLVLCIVIKCLCTSLKKHSRQHRCTHSLL